MRHVLLLTNELATVSAVTSALESNGTLAPEDVCRDLDALATRLEGGRVPAVLVDIDQQSQRVLAAVEALSRRFSETRFVVLSGRMESTLLLEAMQAGARHFMVKQSIPNELAGVLKRLCPPTNAAGGGLAITVLSAGGGCGATTVAINLAAELALLAGGSQSASSLVVDLDYNYGAVATYLGADADYGALDLLDRTGTIDAQLIQSTAISHSGRPHALISVTGRRLGMAASLENKRVGELVDACKGAYACTVIDAPRVPIDVAAELASHSNATLLLLQLTIKDMRVARQMLEGLSQRGVDAESVRLIVNRFRRRGSLISFEEARRAMGLTAQRGLVGLSNDYRAVSQAVNLGKPLAQVSPRSDFRRDLQKLAAGLAEAASLRARLASM